jgi:hypothetical protein
MTDWFPDREDERGLLQSVVGPSGKTVAVGGRVLLRPRRRADIMDIVLGGKTATIVSIERDFEDGLHVSVTVDDDPGSDLGCALQPGHRFFFALDEIEPLGSEPGVA